MHVDGRVLGRHDGIINYTVGQRRGLGVAGPAPLYVVRLDADRKRVVVGPRESLHAHWISLRDVNWLGDAPIPDAGLDVAARIRSSARPQPATVFAQGGAGQGALARRRVWYCCRASLRLLRRYLAARPRAGRRLDRARLEPERAVRAGTARAWTLQRAEPVRMRQG